MNEKKADPQVEPGSALAWFLARCVGCGHFRQNHEPPIKDGRRLGNRREIDGHEVQYGACRVLPAQNRGRQFIGVRNWPNLVEADSYLTFYAGPCECDGFTEALRTVSTVSTVSTVQPNAVTCPQCSGVGFIRRTGEDTQPCSHCRGTGVFPAGGSQAPVCGRCGGAGALQETDLDNLPKWTEDPCVRCGGSGIEPGRGL